MPGANVLTSWRQWRLTMCAWHICCSDVSLHWRVNQHTAKSWHNKLHQCLKNCKYFERNLSLPKVRPLFGFLGCMPQLIFFDQISFSYAAEFSALWQHQYKLGNLPSTCCRHLVPGKEWRASAVIDGYARTGKHAPSILYSLHP